MIDEVAEIERGDRETGVRGRSDNLFDYYRNGSGYDFAKWCRDVSNLPGGTISRSEAAALLGCSRQRIHQIVRSGNVRCWHFHAGYLHDLAIYSELSAVDLLAYAERIGRPIDEVRAMKLLVWTDEVREFFEQRREQGPSKAQEAEWLRRKRELGEQIDREWKSEKSAAEVVSEGRR